MDPNLTAILSALMAGATAGLKDTAATFVKDAYSHLVQLIRQKIGREPDKEMVLDKFCEDPKTWEKLVEKMLLEARMDQNKEIVNAAQILLTLVDQHTQKGKYAIEINGNIQGISVGDNPNITMNFKSNEKRSSRKSK